MNISSEKSEIIQQLLLVNYENILVKINELMDVNAKNYFSVYDEERLVNAVRESEADFNAGRVYTHEEAGKHLEKKIAALKKMIIV